MFTWADVYAEQYRHEDALRALHRPSALQKMKMLYIVSQAMKERSESGRRTPIYLAAAAFALFLLGHILPHAART